ncbi:MAG TPA: protein kinase [Planctomycetota bacterium]|nr:protein kinase [Planctomycetota bacterium]
MGLSTLDFVVAFRALGSRTCSVADLRRALKAQTSLMEKGRRLSLAEALAEEGILALHWAGELAGPAPVDIRSDPATLTATGELFLAADAATETELDRIIDVLARPADPRTLKEVPVPPSLAGYDIAWEVGRSRTGSVYRGSKRGSSEPVAIKVFRQEVFPSIAACRAFLGKMSPGSSDLGPAFIRVLEAKEADGHAVVVQEFVDGAPLETLLAERKLSLRRGFEIVARAAAALAPVHAKGRAHGRLSTRSIFVQNSDRPKIDSAVWPEDAAPADDVASLGGVLYEIAAGVPPFGGFRSTKLKPPSRFNAAAAGPAERIILKALARNPARRYPDAAALAADLDRFLRHEEVTADVEAREASPPSKPAMRSHPRRKREIVIAAAAIISVAVSLIVYKVTRSGSHPPDSKPAPVASVPPPAPPLTPPKAPPPPPAPRPDLRKDELARKGPLKPADEIDFRMRATGLLAKREFGELDRLAEEALIRGPERDWAHHYRAVAALERGDAPAALVHADRAVALGADTPELHELRLEIRLARAEYRLVLEELDRLYPREKLSLENQEILRLGRQIEQDKENAALFIRRGALYLHRRLASRAAEDFQKAVTLGESRAFYFLALALREDQRVEEAGEALRRFIAAHGNLPGAEEARALLASLPK